MKVAPTKNNNKQRMRNKTPLLPLVHNESLDELDKHNSMTVELRSQPAENDSPKYKVTIIILKGGETLRQTMRWRADVVRVMTGLNATTLPQQQPLVEAMLRNQALTAFQNGMLAEATVRYETALSGAADANDRATIVTNGIPHYQQVYDILPACNHVIQAIAPVNSLRRVKQYLRRECRKPVDMKVRTYYNHII